MKRPGRPMFRVVLLPLAWATAGAIVNVAVAWGCAWSFRMSNVKWTTQLRSSEGLMGGELRVRERPYGFQASMTYIRKADVGGTETFNDPTPAWCPHDRAPPQWLVDSESGIAQFEIIEARGWPMLSLMSWNRSIHAGRGVRREDQLAGFVFPTWIEEPPAIGSPRMFPTRPIWPGFAINTVFYAAMLWLLFASPFALRKRRRIKRGLCPKCAYDLRNRRSDSSVCPECGAAFDLKEFKTVDPSTEEYFWARWIPSPALNFIERWLPLLTVGSVFLILLVLLRAIVLKWLD